MGAAICGMHYTGMYAAVFTPKNVEMMSHAAEINPQLLAINIAAVTAIILGIAFAASTYKEAQNQRLLVNARQLGMAEVASSVLHNVGNVLNSVNVSATLIAERIQTSKLSILNDTQKLLEEHKGDMEHFLTQDPRGKQLPEFIISLANYWETEQHVLNKEAEVLVKNIMHIRDVIASQQHLAQAKEIIQIESLEKICNESILITGVEDSTQNITLTKNYARLHPVKLDKVKLLQILINLVQNAKESVVEAKLAQKNIMITTSAQGKFCRIEVQDNGVGIAPGNLHTIFVYGFTTKKTGHGYGLHSCANSAKEMGGSLSVKSDGPGKGATFILDLPY